MPATKLGRPVGTIVTSLLIVALSACSDGSFFEGGLGSALSFATGAVKENKGEQREFRVVSETYFPPFVMLNGEGGVVGFESDLLNAIGELKGVRFTFVTHPWAGIFDTLESGRNDVVAASVTITPERAGKWSFSSPYYASRQTFFSLTPPSGDDPLTNLDGQRVIAKKGTTSDVVIKKRAPGVEKIVYFDSVFTGVKEVLNKRAAGIIGDSGPLKYYAALYSNYSPVVTAVPDEPTEFYGFVVSKYRKDDLLKIIDEGLMELKTNGTYDKLYFKWFNERSRPLPSLEDVLDERFNAPVGAEAEATSETPPPADGDVKAKKAKAAKAGAAKK